MIRGKTQSDDRLRIPLSAETRLVCRQSDVVALILTKPDQGSPFLDLWLKGMPTAFRITAAATIKAVWGDGSA